MKPKDKCKNCETTNPNQPTCKEMKSKTTKKSLNVKCKSCKCWLTDKEGIYCSYCQRAKAETLADVIKIINKRIEMLIDERDGLFSSPYNPEFYRERINELESIKRRLKENLKSEIEKGV